MLNLNSVPGGDTHLQPLNMAPLGTTPEDDQGGENNNIDNAVEDKVKRLIDEADKKGNI